MTLKKYLPWFAARLFLSGIFLTAGFLKLVEPVENFRGMIVSYGVVPYAWVGAIAHTMPWVEWIAGMCLLTGYFPRISAAVLGCLAFSFVALIAAAKMHGTLPENCGCFGDGVHISPQQMIILDAFNILIAVRLAFLKEHKICLLA